MAITYEIQPGNYSDTRPGSTFAGSIRRLLNDTTSIPGVTTVTLEAIPAQGYEFVRWEIESETSTELQ